MCSEWGEKRGEEKSTLGEKQQRQIIRKDVGVIQKGPLGRILISRKGGENLNSRRMRGAFQVGNKEGVDRRAKPIFPLTKGMVRAPKTERRETDGGREAASGFPREG